MMKRIQYGICIALMCFCFGCDDDDNLQELKPEKIGTMIDTEGNEYKWVRYGSLDWMASNLITGVPFYENEEYWGWDDWDYEWVERIQYDDKEQALADYEIYGNLYSYEDAQKYCPEGWRLPTDADWQKLEQVLGMSTSASNSIGWRGAGEGQLLQQSQGLNLQLGGSVCLKPGNPTSWYLRFVRIYGFYWSDTVDKTYENGTAVYYRRIFANNPQIERNVAPIIERDYLHAVSPRLMSVRYVRDAVDD